MPLWRVRSVDGTVIRAAGIYETVAGQELVVQENGEVIYTELERRGIDIVETATALADVYRMQGWLELP